MKQRLPRAFQFGLRTLLLATVVCAAIASLAARMNVPVIYRGIVAILAITYALYIILRLPGLLRRHHAIKKHLDEVREDILFQAEDTRKKSTDSERADAEQQSE